jgi:transcriptional regulator with XRE-family HTH domain
MKDRLLAFLQNENKSYAQFAEEIGVQPSGISHILSGRNNPSLDFVMKMLHRYPSLSAEWLLFGQGPMYKSVSQPTLFDSDIPSGQSGNEEEKPDTDYLPDDIQEPGTVQEATEGGQPGRNADLSTARKLTRIIMFYSDKSFTEYTPS